MNHSDSTAIAACLKTEKKLEKKDSEITSLSWPRWFLGALLIYPTEGFYAQFTKATVYQGLRAITALCALQNDSLDRYGLIPFSYFLAYTDLLTTMSACKITALPDFPFQMDSAGNSVCRRYLQSTLTVYLPHLCMLIAWTAAGLASALPITQLFPNASENTHRLIGLYPIIGTIYHYLMLSYEDVQKTCLNPQKTLLTPLSTLSKHPLLLLDTFIQLFLVNLSYRYAQFAYIGSESANNILHWPAGDKILQVICGLSGAMCYLLTRAKKTLKNRTLHLTINTTKITLLTLWQGAAPLKKKLPQSLNLLKIGFFRSVIASLIASRITSKQPQPVQVTTLTLSSSLPLMHAAVTQSHLPETSSTPISTKIRMLATTLTLISQCVRGLSCFLFLSELLQPIFSDQSLIFYLSLWVSLELAIVNFEYTQPKSIKQFQKLSSFFARPQEPLISSNLNLENALLEENETNST